MPPSGMPHVVKLESISTLLPYIKFPMKTRRSFLFNSALATASLCTTSLNANARTLGANDRIRLGFIGLGVRGMSSLPWFAGIPNVEIAYLCDADQQIVQQAKAKYPNAKTTQDLRHVIDDPEIDAVVISTCNHWHVLASIWACQAGKDIYVEKPVSHNIWEGRQLVNAARKYNRMVQVGTQQRSDPLQKELRAFIDSQKLGKVKYVRCNLYSVRSSIGKTEQPIKPPASLDYDLWLGPAQNEPITRSKLHYDWHWNWNTGNGEMGNWGAHILDDVRNVVFRDQVTLPKRAIAIGGRYGWNDGGETPNTNSLYLDTGSIPVFMNIHNLPRKKDMNAADVYMKRRTSSFFLIEFENGYYAGGRGGGTAYDASGAVIQKFSGNAGSGHAQNFIQAMRNRKASDLAAEIEQGHYSAAWCHLSNISFRLGKGGDFESAKQALQNVPQWTEMIDNDAEHLASNEIQLGKDGYQVGRLLEIDAVKETLMGSSATPEALTLLKRTYRKGFEIPAQV